MKGRGDKKRGSSPNKAQSPNLRNRPRTIRPWFLTQSPSPLIKRRLRSILSPTESHKVSNQTQILNHRARNALRKLPYMRHPWEHVIGMRLCAVFVNSLVNWDVQLKQDLDKILDKAKAANERRYFDDDDD